MCIMPVLMYGCENWIMSVSLWGMLDRFLGELAKRALGWPSHHSNTAAVVALNLTSMRARILLAKLCFLRKRMLCDGGIGGEVVRALSDNPSSMCLVKKCQELEEEFGTTYTERILEGADEVALREVIETVTKIDKGKLVERCEGKAGLIAEVEKDIGWARLWDSVLDVGADGVRGLQNLSRLMSSHGHSNRPCPQCDITNLEGSSPIDHALEVYLGRWGMDKASVIERLKVTNLNV